MAAYSAQVRSIAATQNLHAMIDAVGHYNVALTIKGNTAQAAELPCTAASAAHAAHVGAVAHTEHFNTAVGKPVMHENVPAVINRNAAGIVELPVSTAFAADGSYVAAVAVAQHLHSMITRVSYNDVACTVKRDAFGIAELTSA